MVPLPFDKISDKTCYDLTHARQKFMDEKITKIY